MSRWTPASLGLACAAVVALAFGAGVEAGRWQGARAQRTIVVTDDLVAGLRSDHLRRTGHAATAAEEQVLVARYIDQEILHREALARGLERGDVIVRRRLQQLMELRAEDAATATPPSDAELERELAQNPARYQRPARVAFTQVFIARSTDDRARAEATLLRLRHGAPAGDEGQPFVRGRDFAPSSQAEVAAVFGEEFAAALLALPPSADGGWSGPLSSSYGLHLVRIGGRDAARMPTLDEARAEIARDLAEHRRAHAREQLLEHLRARYLVRRPPGVR